MVKFNFNMDYEEMSRPLSLSERKTRHEMEIGQPVRTGWFRKVATGVHQIKIGSMVYLQGFDGKLIKYHVTAQHHSPDHFWAISSSCPSVPIAITYSKEYGHWICDSEYYMDYSMPTVVAYSWGRIILGFVIGMAGAIGSCHFGFQDEPFGYIPCCAAACAGIYLCWRAV